MEKDISLSEFIDEGMQIPNNEPLQKQYSIGKRIVNVNFMFGTKTLDEVCKNVHEDLKREFFMNNL